MSPSSGDRTFFIVMRKEEAAVEWGGKGVFWAARGALTDGSFLRKQSYKSLIMY